MERETEREGAGRGGGNFVNKINEVKYWSAARSNCGESQVSHKEREATQGESKFSCMCCVNAGRKLYRSNFRDSMGAANVCV